MCASYGVEAAETADSDAARPSNVRFVPLTPLDEARNAERMRRWAREHGGKARITGRIARNLNPVIHALRGERELALAWWWLHIGGVPAEYSAFNSRDDKLLRSWRDPFQRRALLPASWYIEKGKRFGLAEGEMFGIAAITSLAKQPDGSNLLSYSMVTREAEAQAATVHHRMPLVLPREFHDAWLDPERPGDEGLLRDALNASAETSSALAILFETNETSQPEAPPQPTLF